ncbi:MAG: hypothetical protein K6E50_12620 [Lachnospiraceae bacterium]|nr:hypothetical protein [Lachnospiraceae bacterium]
MERKTKILLGILAFVLIGGGVLATVLFLSLGSNAGNNSGSNAGQKQKVDIQIPDVIKNVVLPSASTSEPKPVHAEEILQIGQHIYYSERLFENRHADEKERQEILDYLEEADQHVSRDVYICGSFRNSITDEPCMNAYQYLNGAIIPNVFFRTDDDLPYPNLVDGGRGTPVRKLDTSGLLDGDELAEKAISLAEQNKNKMMVDRTTGEIYGTYRLEYDEERDILYYSYQLNEYSQIKLDARTGYVVEEYYFNGEFPD